MKKQQQSETEGVQISNEKLKELMVLNMQMSTRRGRRAYFRSKNKSKKNKWNY